MLNFHMRKLKTIAIIPARGGSKRIPHKNIMDFMGKPLIAWTIEAAKEAAIFDRIIVSTDDRIIAEIAEGYGVEVPFLRNGASDDITPVSIATIESVKQAQECWGEEYNVVMQLMATCPLRNRKEIINSFNHFIQAKVNYQLSCFKFNYMNPWWAFKLKKDYRPEYIFKKFYGKRSQDLPELYCPTGAIWIAKTKDLIRENSFYGNGHIFYPIDWKAAIDIDNFEDAEFAEAVFRQNCF